MYENPAPRILITRLSHIGDCILTLPLANALKDAFPGATIAWAVESPSHQLLAWAPAVDRIINVPRSWVKQPSAWRELRREFVAFRPDVTLDPQSLTKSALLARLSGARLRVGLGGRWGRELAPWLNNCRITPEAPHLVDRTLALLEAFDLPVPAEARFGLAVDPAAGRRIDQFLNHHSMPQFAVVNPGASWPSKRWEIDRWAKVIRGIWDAHQLRSVISWAGDEEQEMANAIACLAGVAAVAAPATRLTELAALVSRALVYLGCDTGPTHLAAAMGTPCVGLYGPTRPEESGAYGAQHVALQAWYQSGTCRERRGGENTAMRAIAPDQVLAATSRLLSGGMRRAA